MQRGFVVGVGLGAAFALTVGLTLAFVPTTPTWTLWRLTLALDRGDVQELTEVVDMPAVALNAVQDLQSQSNRNDQAVPLSRLALAFLSGDRVRTVFDDPDHPLEVTAGDFLAAWWSMRREDRAATLTLRAGDRQLDLSLEQQDDLAWKIVSVSPLGSLLRIEESSDPT